jgi:hypothetical protein
VFRFNARHPSDNLVAHNLSNDIFESPARLDSSSAKIRRQIELAVKQAFPCAVSLLPKPSAPKLQIAEVAEVANWKLRID